MQLSYTSGSSALSDRSRFKKYFRNSPAFEIVSPALRSAVNNFGWRRIALLTQDETVFTGVRSKLHCITHHGVTTVKSKLIIIAMDLVAPSFMGVLVKVYKSLYVVHHSMHSMNHTFNLS